MKMAMYYNPTRVGTVAAQIYSRGQHGRSAQTARIALKLIQYVIFFSRY